MKPNSRNERRDRWTLETQVSAINDDLDDHDGRLDLWQKIFIWTLATGIAALLSLTGSLALLVLKGT